VSQPPDPEAVETLEDFARFLDALADHFEDNRGNKELWKRRTINHFLDGMFSWLHNGFLDPRWQRLAREHGVETPDATPSWKLFARTIDAGRGY